MTTSAAAPARHALEQACAAVGLHSGGAEPVRLAENQIWRLPGQQVIVRIARAGQAAAAQREVRVAHWLAENNVPAVRLIDVPQPVEADGRPITFWEELPPHEHGTVADVAQLLRQLHSLPAPELDLGYLDPFVRIGERLQAAKTLNEDDRAWLHSLHQDLVAEWAERPAGRPDCAVHGDAWPGNLVRIIGGGRLLMDLERFSLGPPEWDLVSTAVRTKTTGAVTEDEYDTFCEAYGYDVTEWAGYQILAGARELRMVTYAAQHAASNPEWAAQAQYRVDCLRGRQGPRPWKWKGIM
ncbi:aminoglycoside phosphotransferase [Streptomyces hygroscopicus subsp. sporocinereus]|uniref:Aminoglycoside phosphotransferase n=1 Tax=Streptomyces hygroscopicus TaxID=1912 RepID=A0ABQ3U017_STRHY|nr:aminoglycoside phosphotransferase family protein [Streptomyces hygroscopicus]GHJ28553.1 aminoglycoside phosphotransferase [Streptomyces hygroscopicus]